MRLRLYFVCLFMSGIGMLYAADPKDHDIAPSVLPHTTRAMRTAGFWLTRHADPQKIILSASEIVTFNKHIQDDQHLTKDIFALTQDFKTDTLVSDFDKITNDFIQKDLYTRSGVRDSGNYLDKAKLNMNAPGLVLGVAPRYALVVHYADVRFLPMDEPLFESPGDVDFDQVQNSTLDVGTAVAVVHVSADKKWYYIFAALSQGWIQADRVALGDAKTIKDFSQDESLVVAVVAKADIFLNTQMTQQHDAVRMGTRLPLVKDEGERLRVRVPVFDADNKLLIVDGFVRPREFHAGYLPYTAQNIMTQAFVMLDRPYGWGGMYGEQDCSAFLDEVFSTVGIVLPRDSKDQSLAGKIFTEFKPEQKNEERIKAFENAIGGQTILPMKGHIMLYLGSFEGRLYAIHSVWAYRVHLGDKDIPKVINKVAVSDLSLGEGSAKGSLLKRLTKIISIQ